MAVLEQFILNNLLPAIIAGLLTWLFVVFALNVLKIEYGWFRISLMYAPIIKSILVLLGIGLVIQWPREVFATWSAQSVSFNLVIPFLLLWLGISILLRYYFAGRARGIALANAVTAQDAAPRLQASLQRVQKAYEKLPAELAGQGAIVCVKKDIPAAKILVSAEGLDTPLILVNEKEPTIVFPKNLLAKLNDDELDMAIAHEYAHFMLTNPAWCSSEGMRHMTSVSPVARLLSAEFEREEEKACDDMAITALGKSEAYPEMLLTSFRFAAEQKSPLNSKLQVLPQLLGVRPIFTERLERLLGEVSPQMNLGYQCFAVGLAWIGISVVFGFV